MNHSNPRSLLVITALLTSTAFAGCGSDAASAPPDAAPPTASNKDLAVAALTAVFGNKNASAIDTYFAPTFIRHDPSATADGTAAFKAQLSAEPGGISWKYFRAYAQDDLVVVHDEYDGFPKAGVKSISFDLL